MTAQVQLDASGNGTASIGPVGTRETWEPQNAHVSVSTAINEATCTIYAGDLPQPMNFRDETFSGSSGDSTDRVNATTLRNPEKVFAVWQGGDPHAIATLVVTGVRNVV